jgi:competence protein ComEC
VQPLVVLLAAFCVGIVVDRYSPIDATWWWMISLAACGVSLVVQRVMQDASQIAAAFLLAATLAAGGAWHHFHWHLFDADELGRFAVAADQPVVVEGVLAAAPKIIAAPAPNPMQTIPEGDKTLLELHVERLRDGTGWRRVSGSVVLLVDGHAIVPQAADRVRAYAMLSTPSAAANPGQFDFAAYERASGHLCLLRGGFPESVVVVEQAPSWEPRRWLEDVRESGKRQLRRHIDPRQSGLAAALLLGAREDLDREQTEDFFATGAIHLLAISGLHVGILAMGAWLLGRVGLLSRRTTLLAVVLLVLAYALLTEMRPPVVRASMLIGAFCLAQYCGRPAASFNVLALAGFVVLAIGPAQLFQVGTQLSFLAVATLLVSARWLAPRREADPLDRLIARSRPWPIRAAKSLSIGIAKLWLVSTAVWLVALPLVTGQFHLVAPAAVVLNPLLWLPVAAALYAGFGVMLLGWLAPPLGDFLGWICRWNLELVEWILHAARSVPGSHVWVAGPGMWWVIGFYVLLAVFLLVPVLRSRLLWCASISAVWLAVGYFAAGDTPSAVNDGPQLDCTFVSVGHGTSVLLELPDGRTLLYDAGTLSSPHQGGQRVAGVLWSRGVSHLDAIIVSHADSDHYNAIPELLGRFSVGAIYVSPVMFRDDSPALEALRARVASAGVPLYELSSLDLLATPRDYRLEILHPLPGGVNGSDNANSIVLAVEFAGRRILLPGDLESPGLEDVLAEEPLDCDVVMAPHHGSLKSNAAGFSAWSTPEYVVVSGGRDENLARVKAAYDASGAKVLHTAEDGAVRVTIDRRSLTVRTWLGDGW